MPDALDNYFQRVNPTLNRPEEGAARLPSIDIYRAWDRWARLIAVTMPAALDRARSFRNRFLRAVQ